MPRNSDLLTCKNRALGDGQDRPSRRRASRRTMHAERQHDEEQAAAHRHPRRIAPSDAGNHSPTLSVPIGDPSVAHRAK
jgi:hypothetical protein